MRIHSSRNKSLKNYPEHVPDEMLSEDWADVVHGQTLKRLDERGGMGVNEILLNIRKQRWNTLKEDTQEDIDYLNKLIQEYYNQK